MFSDSSQLSSSRSTPCLSCNTVVRNLPPTTTGHNDHWFFSCLPLICWCGLRHDRWWKSLTSTSHTCPRERLLSSITILLYPMTSSPVTPIQDNTQPHSSATLLWDVPWEESCKQNRLFNRTEDSDEDVWTRLRRSWVLSEEEWVVCVRETTMSIINITVSHWLRLVPMYVWSWVWKWGPHKCLCILSLFKWVSVRSVKINYTSVLLKFDDYNAPLYSQSWVLVLSIMSTPNRCTQLKYFSTPL
jgi:hypothetical protein